MKQSCPVTIGESNRQALRDHVNQMEFRIADTFTDSLARLTSEEQKAVKTTAFNLQMNPAQPIPTRSSPAPFHVSGILETSKRNLLSDWSGRA
jgi:hypothetical protein